MLSVSVIYSEYLKLKKKNKESLYLFKSGNFYIFVGDDALYISKITTLKLSNFSSEAKKCGFPINSLDKYLNIFNNLKIKVKVIDNLLLDEKVEKIIFKKSKCFLFLPQIIVYRRYKK